MVLYQGYLLILKYFIKCTLYEFSILQQFGGTCIKQKGKELSTWENAVQTALHFKKQYTLQDCNISYFELMVENPSYHSGIYIQFLENRVHVNITIKAIESSWHWDDTIYTITHVLLVNP